MARDEGDGQITSIDFSNTPADWIGGSRSAHIDKTNGVIDDPTINAMVKHQVRDALLAGRTRLTLSLSLPNRLDGIAQNGIRLNIATDLPAVRRISRSPPPRTMHKCLEPLV